MDLSKREKGLFFATLAVAAVLLLDQYALTPLLEQQDQLRAQRDQILTEMSRAQKIMLERKQLGPKWHTMLSSGLKTDPAAAEGELLHALRDWAKDTGFSISSLKPERPDSKEPLKEIHIQAAGTGSMNEVGKFLFKMQSASFPLKLTEFQLGQRNNSSAELALQIKISTLYCPPEKKKEANGDSKKVASAETSSRGGVK